MLGWFVCLTVSMVTTSKAFFYCFFLLSLRLLVWKRLLGVGVGQNRHGHQVEHCGTHHGGGSISQPAPIFTLMHVLLTL